MDFSDSLSTNGVAVIGAGTMGSGIAQKIAQVGIPVFLVDREQGLAEAGKRKIVSVLNEAVERRIFTTEEVAAILAWVTPTADLDLLKEVALVIEAVFEDKEVKRTLFQRLHAVCAPETVFATNTSSLSVAELGETAGREDRFGGLHFFFHPAKNRLLEVIAAGATSSETAHFLWQFGRLIDKTCIRVADRPGFAVNRFFVPWLNEAVRLFEEGVADIPTIEAAAKIAFGIGMGPFELMNVTGIPIAFHAAETLGKSLGHFYVPAPGLVEQAERREDWDLDGKPDESRFDEVADRLLGCA
ncbi:MAG: 3-hydroxyacyl-CoA dehydrogenase family protein, partial [Rhodothermales bacterium]